VDGHHLCATTRRSNRAVGVLGSCAWSAPRARSARRLAGRFEVSPRTIERDILALQQAGVPIWATPGPGGGYTIDPGHTLPPLNFTASEAAAIALALARSGPMPFDGAARTALHKLAAAMSATGRTSAADLLARIHLLHAKRELPAAPVLRAVEQAVLERRVLCLDYRDKHGHPTVARRVEPLGFVGAERDWYLVGWCRLRGGVRVFRLDRIGMVDEGAGAVRSPTTAPTRRSDPLTRPVAGGTLGHSLPAYRQRVPWDVSPLRRTWSYARNHAMAPGWERLRLVLRGADGYAAPTSTAASTVRKGAP